MPVAFASNHDLLYKELQNASYLCLFLDFDGTLAAIEETPAECALPHDLRKTLAVLASLPRTQVSIISGRALHDVRDRIGLEPLIYAGNHGLEIEGPGFSWKEDNAIRLSDELRDLVNRVERALSRIPGAWVENKHLTASVHYRQVNPEEIPQVFEMVQNVTAQAREQQRFVLRPGKKVLEIRPALAWNKSHALDWILKRTLVGATPAVLYFGDDVTDEDVFSTWPTAITVGVGVSLDSSARFMLKDQTEVHEALQWILEWHLHQRASTVAGASAISRADRARVT